MKKISELAYKLYLMGLEKEAGMVDDLTDKESSFKICANCGAKNSLSAIECTSCGHKEFVTPQVSDAKDKKKKKDACYYKVKSRYKKWPSAYASGALVKCREVGAKNWGEGGKKKKKKSKKKK